MKKPFVIKGLKVTGALILAYGLGHNLTTALTVDKFQNLSTSYTSAFLFMFLFTGSSLMLFGYLIMQLSQDDANAFLMVVIAIFLTIGGISALVSMDYNFYSIIFLAISLSNLMLSLMLLKQNKNDV